MRLTYQPDENALRLTLDQEPVETVKRIGLPGYVDVGEGGRLVGVELAATAGVDLPVVLDWWLHDELAGEHVTLSDDSAYIELSVAEDASPHEQVRAVPASLGADIDRKGRLAALLIPRRGTGYEISYPSGNQ